VINKFNFPKNNDTKSSEHTPLMYIGLVESINDNNDAGRIVVRIKGIDDEKKTENNKSGKSELMEAFPLLPKMINVFPKVGESVFIFTQYFKETRHRYWIGPIISQPQMLKNDEHFGTSQSALVEGSNIALDVAPSTIPDANGVYPDKKFVSIQGRDNTDIVHKDSEIILRAGKFVKNKPLKYNDKSQGLIQIKSFMRLGGGLDKNGTKKPFKIGSVVNLVGNKINLISLDGDGDYDILNTNEKIQEEVIRDIVKNAHPLVFGDLLIEYLKIQRNFELNHIHEYINLGPNDNQPEYLELSQFPLEDILSKNIRIN